MPSSYTASLRFELQGVGENLNTWGLRLNSALSRIDKAIAGWTTIALTGNYSLTSSNGDDEARSASLKFTGAGPFTVTIPAVAKQYLIWNACTAAVTVTTGAGTTQVLAAGERTLIGCDGSDVTGIGFGSLGWKAYVDAQAWAGVAGVLPGQAGNAGKFLKTDGTTPAWTAPATTDLSDIAAYTAASTALSVAMAVALR